MINSNLKSVQINKYIIDKKEKKVHTVQTKIGSNFQNNIISFKAL